ARGGAEAVPDRFAASLLVGRAFDLIGGCCSSPGEVVRKLDHAISLSCVCGTRAGKLSDTSQRWVPLDGLCSNVLSFCSKRMFAGYFNHDRCSARFNTIRHRRFLMISIGALQYSRAG